MKKLLLSALLLVSVFSYGQYDFNMIKQGSNIDNYPKQKMSVNEKDSIESDTIKESLIVIVDTINYLLKRNIMMFDGINDFHTQTRKGQYQLLLGSSLSILGTLLYSNTNDTTKPFSYIVLGTGIGFNISGAINILSAYRHINFKNKL